MVYVNDGLSHNLMLTLFLASGAISEYEQSALQYRPQLLPLLIDKQEPEVWAFGHILYEMATGGQVRDA